MNATPGSSSTSGGIPEEGVELPRQSPLFLTGFARSGTTWVNRLLREYFDAGFVNEGQFIVSFGLRLAHYGDLHRDDNFKRLLSDLRSDQFFSILSHNYDVEIDWRKVANVSPTFRAIVLEILHQISVQTGKPRIGSKYPVFGRYLDLLNNIFPDCRVIHVIRDGRDCALSHQRLSWGHQNSYSAAVHWRRYIELARRGSRDMQGRYIEIRYEDLLLHPGKSMHDLERFITGSNESEITRRFIENAGSLKSDKVARWRQDMSSGSQAIFESVAGDVLEQCGYPLNGIAYRPSFLARTAYRIHDRMTREGWSIARKVFKNLPERK